MNGLLLFVFCDRAGISTLAVRCKRAGPYCVCGQQFVGRVPVLVVIPTHINLFAVFIESANAHIFPVDGQGKSGGVQFVARSFPHYIFKIKEILADYFVNGLFNIDALSFVKSKLALPALFPRAAVHGALHGGFTQHQFGMFHKVTVKGHFFPSRVLHRRARLQPACRKVRSLVGQ